MEGLVPVPRMGQEAAFELSPEEHANFVTRHYAWCQERQTRGLISLASALPCVWTSAPCSSLGICLPSLLSLYGLCGLDPQALVPGL